MPSTTVQRKLASQFVAVTNATRENAAHFLKNANYNLDAAVNLYFSSTEPDDGVQQNRPDEKLGELFESLLSKQDRDADESKNTMGAESLEAYAGQLSVNHVNFELFVLLDVVQAEGLGQITRRGFIEGWKAAGTNREYKIEPEISSQKGYIRHYIDKLARDPAYFKRIYQRAFLTGKEPQQKAIDKDIAIVFWDMLFDPAVHPWRTRNVNWLDLWKTFLEAKWKRSVNKDMWSQTLVFADKTMQDETLSFWSEDQAWPNVIDEFVLWCRDTGAVPPPKKAADGMEVD